MRNYIFLLFLCLAVVPTSLAQTWEAQTSGTANLLQGVWFTTTLRGFAVGDAGTVLHTEDGGQTWVPILLTDGDMLDLAFVDPLIGLIVGDSGRVFRTTDGGDTWVQMASDTEENLLGVAFGEGGLAYAAGRNGAIVRSTDNGATWSFVGSGTERYRGVAAVGQTAWVVGNSGAIRRSLDGGLNWLALDAGTAEDLHAVSFVSESEGWIAGQSNTLLYTDDGGLSWSSRNSSIGVGLNAVFFGNSNLGWTGGRFGNIFGTTDGALSWDAQNTQGIDEVNDLSFVDAFHGWAVGDGGSIVFRQVPSVEITLDGEEIDWQPWPGATVYDVVRGDLVQLRNTDGNFEPSTLECFSENLLTTTVAHGADPGAGEAFWFVVRVVADGDNMTYDSESFRQFAGRDTGIAGSGMDCF